MKINVFPPALIIYTDDLPDDVGGRSFGPYVRIRPKYRDDEGILQHELSHVELWWLTFGLNGLIERIFPPYRLWNEARAYRVQVLYGITLDDAAERLASAHYGFGITTEQAIALIKR
jgi:hypothetical protein